VAATGILCPCHVLSAGAFGLLALIGAQTPALTPELQDAVHVTYVPAALLLAARLLKRPKADPGEALSKPA
jgi:hypothetical protein